MLSFFHATKFDRQVQNELMNPMDLILKGKRKEKQEEYDEADEKSINNVVLYRKRRAVFDDVPQ